MKIQKPTTSTDNMTDFTDKRFVTDAEKTKLSNTSGTNTGDQSIFSTVAVSGQSNVVADTTSDTLTLVAGTGITITTDATADSVTINASSGYTDEQAQDAVGNAVGNGLAYNDGTGAIAFGNLTSDWTSTGSGDIILGNVGANLKIMENAGGGSFGTFDVGSLSGDVTYTFPDYTMTPIGTTATGTAGQVLTSSGSTTVAPIWVTQNENFFDYVNNGCVWTGDAYASTKAASMTAGIVYINGTRIVVSAVTARTFTASKDTYIDLGVDGTIDYNEVANNAASPALAASHIRLGIIVTGASNIANAGSVNQGEETKVLPIASSIPYQVTDSLGNLICPRDPNRRILGARRRLATFNATTIAAVTECRVPVIVPSGRKVKVSFSCYAFQNTTVSNYAQIFIWDTEVTSGTIIAGTISRGAIIGGQPLPCSLMAITTPTATSKTYVVSLDNAGATTAQIDYTAGAPISLIVELV